LGKKSEIASRSELRRSWEERSPKGEGKELGSSEEILNKGRRDRSLTGDEKALDA